jgi:hypothetical protein
LVDRGHDHDGFTFTTPPSFPELLARGVHRVFEDLGGASQASLSAYH